MQDSHDAYLPFAFVYSYLIVCTYFLNDLIIAVFFIKFKYLESEIEKHKLVSNKPFKLARAPSDIFSNHNSAAQSRNKLLKLIKYKETKNV